MGKKRKEIKEGENLEKKSEGKKLGFRDRWEGENSVKKVGEKN